MRTPVQPIDRPPARQPLRPAQESTPQSLTDRVRWLNALDRLLRQSLPPALASQCSLANVRNGRLVFLANSSALAARLRLHTADLLAAAASAGVNAEALAVKVATMQPVPPDPTPRTPLSPAARDALRAAADAVSDPDLREQLLRLAFLAE